MTARARAALWVAFGGWPSVALTLIGACIAYLVLTATCGCGGPS
jgi:hypothetical protein